MRRIDRKKPFRNHPLSGWFSLDNKRRQSASGLPVFFKINITEKFKLS